MNPTITTLDVREDFRSGQHPCDKIKSALSGVALGETLRLLVPFEPVPLYQIAEAKGLGHEARPTSGGDWEVLFTIDPSVSSSAQSGEISAASCGCTG